MLSVRMQILSAVILSTAMAAPNLQSYAQQKEGFILKKGEGESLLNGIVVKASPATGTEGSILGEQTFPKGGTTSLHIHDQGDELFYVVSGRGTATLGNQTEEIGPGDVIFVPRGAAHAVSNPSNDEALKVIFLMDSPELVEQFRAMHEWKRQHPDQTLTPEIKARIGQQTGGGRPAN